MSRQVVSIDTSFWVHAGMVGGHAELLNDYDLTVTSEVADELGVNQASPTSVSGRALKAALSANHARLLDPAGPLIGEFHKGEKAVLSLALEQPGKVIPLIDEQKAYQWAVKRGLAVMSVPLWLASKSITRPEEIPITMSKIKALVVGRHLSMILAHEAMILLTAASASKGGS